MYGEMKNSLPIDQLNLVFVGVWGFETKEFKKKETTKIH
jgi:hypothetical protein